MHPKKETRMHLTKFLKNIRKKIEKIALLKSILHLKY